MAYQFLHTVKIPTKGKAMVGRIEVPVAQETAPYLVTTSKKLMWVEEAPQGVLYAAIRTDSRLKIYQDIVEMTFSRSKDSQWENIFPLSADGLSKAIEHMKFYGIEDVQILLTKSTSCIKHPQVKIVSWMPENQALLVPKNPEYLGTSFVFGHKNYAMAVHNPSRGMAFLCR